MVEVAASQRTASQPASQPEASRRFPGSCPSMPPAHTGGQDDLMAEANSLEWAQKNAQTRQT